LLGDTIKLACGLNEKIQRNNSISLVDENIRVIVDSALFLVSFCSMAFDHRKHIIRLTMLKL